MRDEASGPENDALRPPEEVMRLARLGSMHPTRLSFIRSLLRGLHAEGWRFDRPLWDVDATGVGRAVYRAIGPDHTYSLVAFAHELPDAQRSDRVIATAWDATFALVDGEPDAADLDRLARNVPLQEAGRISDRELSLSRANRSVRLWSHVVESLAAGVQPDVEQIDGVGYLMRTTAVYGAGKFGAADHALLAGRGLMSRPFHAEMLAVWLIRSFTIDLVEHLGRARSGDRAATLEPKLRRRLGVGNSTGLGMAPFLVNHPALINAWFLARETAVARVRSIEEASPAEQAIFRDRLARARINAARWRSDSSIQIAKLSALRADLEALAAHVEAHGLDGPRVWDRLMLWATDNLSTEGQEQCAALILEPYGDVVDGLADAMGADEQAVFRIDGAMTIAALRSVLARRFGWAQGIDFAERDPRARFWYVSEEKLEPRLGQRFEEPGAEREQPLAVARDVTLLNDALAEWDDLASVAEFLRQHPQHRHVVRRAQIAADRPYAEIQDNLIDASVLPVDLLRAKLSIFGATRFDPRSDRWVRICMYQGAPFPAELAAEDPDEWAYPPIEAADV